MGIKRGNFMRLVEFETRPTGEFKELAAKIAEIKFGMVEFPEKFQTVRDFVEFLERFMTEVRKLETLGHSYMELCKMDGMNTAVGMGALQDALNDLTNAYKRVSLKLSESAATHQEYKVIADKARNAKKVMASVVQHLQARLKGGGFRDLHGEMARFVEAIVAMPKALETLANRIEQIVLMTNKH
jgi:uncharacterized protein YukE